MRYEEIKELQKKIPNTNIIKKIGFCGLWEYGLFCSITGLEIKPYFRGVRK